MNILRVKIQTLEDAGPGRNKSVMPELNPENTKVAEEMTVCIMEDMTSNHKAGICFVMKNKDGSNSVYTVTEGNFNMMIGAYNGAIDSFKELRIKREN